jgi:rubrerythrin
MIHPDQLVQSMQPMVTEAMRVYDTGASLQSVLREVATASFLMGRGATPEQAMETVMRWRMSGLAPSLIRAQRAGTETGFGLASAPPVTVGTATADAMPEEGAAPEAESQGQQRASQPQLIEKFMQDEANAAAFYQALVDAIADPAVKDYVRHAMEDEQKHYRMLGDLYRRLTGRTYEARPEPPALTDVLAGLKQAMDNEYEAMEEYRNEYLRATDRAARNLWFELMTDELEHATRFNYALQVLTR